MCQLPVKQFNPFSALRRYAQLYRIAKSTIVGTPALLLTALTPGIDG